VSFVVISCQKFRVSGKQVLDDISVDIGETVAATLKAEGQFCVVDAQAVEQCGMQVVDVDRVLGDVIAVVIGAAVSLSAFDTAASQP
jgi:hypothetical protein